MQQRILFIDRDGTLIVEPQDNYQIDSLEKLEFLPKVLSAMQKIAASKLFRLVMVTNQDGLGTDSFPEADFWLPHNKMLKSLENEGIVFDEIHIDKTFEHENAPTRKPRTGMLTDYLEGFDLANSFVIGDRLTDVELAKNLGSKSILYGGLNDQNATLCSSDWAEIADFLLNTSRTAHIKRKTLETDIEIKLDLDGTGKNDIRTGIGFFDHILEQVAKHGRLDLQIKVKGDLHIDQHHSIEDTALALGEAFLKALGNKRGIFRYGHFSLPMDECLANVALDFSGRPFLVWKANFKREKVGDMPTEMFEHFFKSFSDTAKCNLNICCEGANEHHQIEAIFKAFAKAIRMAVAKDNHHDLPSTKGVL